MTSYISAVLRQRVRDRAGNRCEYCRIHEKYTLKRHEIDHVYAEKHGGETEAPNLCLSCAACNRYKSSDLCSLDPLSGDVVTLYNPRHDRWTDHFRLEGARIEPTTPQGRVTVRLFHLNDRERLIERERLVRIDDSL